ncbi:hypothetical protein [Williamsia soli]|uniref:hypothetical protein n=1 Tax=Williamsia soli TaxID=364929 RepID=UPI001A9F6E0D|nr:hypothetical protein [Williamsia soli]
MNRTLSIWRLEPDAPDGVTPDEVLPRLSAVDAERVANYLDAGTLVARMTARAVDPWSIDDTRQVPQNQRTDGLWRWSDSVGFYARNYGVNPGAEFVNYLRDREFVVEPAHPHAVAAHVDELLSGTIDATERRLTLDGSQLLTPGTYCTYQERVLSFKQYGRGSDLIRLAIRRGETVPEDFEPAKRPVDTADAFAHKVVPSSAVDSPFTVVMVCRYKHVLCTVNRIRGNELVVSVTGDGLRRPRPDQQPQPSLRDWIDMPNATVWDRDWIQAIADVGEVSELAMAIVPCRMYGNRAVPLDDPTGLGYLRPRAEEIHRFPAPTWSPFLSRDDALRTVSAFLAAQGAGYPRTNPTLERFRDGWRLAVDQLADTVYLVTDDGHIVPTPSSTSDTDVDRLLSTDLRRRHPAADPPPDFNPDIFN